MNKLKLITIIVMVIFMINPSTKAFVVSTDDTNSSTQEEQKSTKYEEYSLERKLFLLDESRTSLGGDVLLDPLETAANTILMRYKHEEIDRGFLNDSELLPSRSFLEVRTKIEESHVFKILLKMPKGASLHSHDTAMVSADYLVHNLTRSYEKDLYVKLDQSGKQILEFKYIFDQNDSYGGNLEPDQDYEEDGARTNWKNLNDFREDFLTDDQLRKQLTLHAPKDVGLPVDAVWKRFVGLFRLMGPLLMYEPAWSDYFRQSLREFYEDGVLYLEFRGTLPNVYRSDGSVLDALEICQLYVDVLREFKDENPGFHGAKFIYAPHRGVGADVFRGYMKTARDLKERFPEFVAGFDLVGQEDLGRPLADSARELLELGGQMALYFHAGETKWSGLSTDQNMMDALLLGTKRIGHGYAILKHPKVLQLIRDKRIGVELCPISNQVLGLVRDMRNHPAAAMLMDNTVPVVISSDDPGHWGVRGVTYDWYEVFMGLASRTQDLHLLKRLALNSIEQSSLTDAQRKDLTRDWNARWRWFLREVVEYDKGQISLRDALF